METNNNIPKHWERTKASEVGKLLRGVNYKKEEASYEAKTDYLPVLRGNNINGELNFEDLVYVQEKNISKEQLIKTGDIVFAMSSGSKHLVGKSAKAKTDFNGSFGAFCGVFRPNENYNKDFVAYFFQSPYYKKVISEISKGTNINNLKREHILNLDFPSPPLPEQQAIVAKIEELLSELENGKQQLQTAQQQLKVYRQSLLKWAFEGKLTAHWRQQQTDKDYSLAAEPETKYATKDDELPEGWKCVSVKDVCNKIIGGGTPSTSVSEYWNGNIPWITSADIYGIKDIRPRKKITTKGIENSTTNLLSKGGIIVVTRVSLGRIAIAPFDLCFSQDSQGLLLNEKLISKEYALWVLHKEVQIFIHQSRGTTIKGVTKKQLEDLLIALPPIEEQQLIVSELESKLTICDKIEETISQSLQQAETLRQSILKKAFEGRLV